MKIKGQTILDAALPVFKAHGIRSTSLHDVAMAGGMRIQDLKLHYPSKKVLVSAFVDYFLIRHTTYLQINPAVSPTAIIELQNFFRFIEKLASELTPTMIFDLKRYDRGSWNKLIEFKDRRLFPYLQMILERGVKEGYYREDLDLNLYNVIYFNLLLEVVAKLKDWDELGKRILQEYHKIFLRGILTTRAVRM